MGKNLFPSAHYRHHMLQENCLLFSSVLSPPLFIMGLITISKNSHRKCPHQIGENKPQLHCVLFPSDSVSSPSFWCEQLCIILKCILVTPFFVPSHSIFILKNVFKNVKEFKGEDQMIPAWYTQ